MEFAADLNRLTRGRSLVRSQSGPPGPPSTSQAHTTFPRQSADAVPDTCQMAGPVIVRQSAVEPLTRSGWCDPRCGTPPNRVLAPPGELSAAHPGHPSETGHGNSSRHRDPHRSDAYGLTPGARRDEDPDRATELGGHIMLGACEIPTDVPAPLCVVITQCHTAIRR